MNVDDSKVCAHCGRQIESRRMSTANWAALKYCSARCRRSAGARLHRTIEDEIVRLVALRGSGSSICPSEAARSVFGERWKAHMEDVRSAARRLAHSGQIVITQRGQRVDPSTIRGPVRLARGS